MNIKKLKQLTREDMQGLGKFGYRVTHQYEVSKTESEQSYAIQMHIQPVDQPYDKWDLITDGDYTSYLEMIELGYSYGAFDRDQLVGLVISEPQAWNNTLLIWHIQVHEAYRMKSIGRQLLSHITSLASEGGYRAVTLETQNTNTLAIAFYQKCGFRIEGIDLSLYDPVQIGGDEVALFLRKRVKEL